MFKVEIRNIEKVLLGDVFEQADYPLVNLYFTTGDVEILTISEPSPTGESYKSFDDTILVNIMIPESVFKSITGEVPGKSQKKISLPTRKILDEMLHCSCHPKFKNIYLRTKITELLILLLSATSLGPRSHWKDKEHSVFIQLKHIISQNLKQNYSIAELAGIAGMNRTKMQTGFKEHFGTTIYAFTLNLKMDKAKALLTGEREVCLKEIAAMLGYKHSHHFSAAFNKRFGVSPSLFKKTSGGY